MDQPCDHATSVANSGGQLEPTALVGHGSALRASSPTNLRSRVAMRPPLFRVHVGDLIKKAIWTGTADIVAVVYLVAVNLQAPRRFQMLAARAPRCRGKGMGRHIIPEKAGMICSRWHGPSAI